ncbi:MAG: hypothetical protein H7A25_23875 [Leptospiraceae bacterium]|nr:hypothetical protein [Leptospiraceae bacterium]MCP5502961.1 hypothetical protein [Leptospiraceae bacterium]
MKKSILKINKIFSYILIFLISLLFSTYLLATEEYKVGVLNLDYNGIEEFKAKDFSDKFRKELGKAKIYAELIPENKVNTVIDLNRERLKGCKGISCTILIGKLLKLDKIVDGNISKKEDGSFIIRFFVINIKEKRVEFSKSFIVKDLKEVDDKILSFNKDLKNHSLGIDTRQKSNMKYLWRSAVFPGWGQHYDNRHTSGYVYNTLFVGSFLYYYFKRKDFLDKKSAYDKTPFFMASETLNTYYINTALLENNKAPYRLAEKNLNNASILLGLVYITNLADAYYLSGEKELKLPFQFQLFSHTYKVDQKELYREQYAIAKFTFSF